MGVESKLSRDSAVCFAVVIVETVLSTLPVARIQQLRTLHRCAIAFPLAICPEWAFLLLRQRRRQRKTATNSCQLVLMLREFLASMCDGCSDGGHARHTGQEWSGSDP
jgi:hypothetical protein